MSLQLYFLGPLDMRSNGNPLPKPPTSNSQSLLAYLALHRCQPLPRDRLVSLFWAERPERNARRSLSTALWHVRRCLPDESLLISDTHTVQFNQHCDLWLDVEEFETLVSRADLASLQAALNLYRGDLLEGFYDEWILSERYRLEALLVEVLARLMAAYEAAGDHQAALAAAQRLLQRDPLHEDAHRLAMRAYCRLGRRNAALEQYEHCREIVRKELGAELMDETTALYRTILNRDFQIGPLAETLPVQVPAIPRAGRTGRSPLDVVAPIRLVGREEEMARLHDTWREVKAGHGALALIGGEAGVGKTRLVEELSHQLRWQSVRVLWGRCYEFERALPYQPFAEALHTLLSGLPDDELALFPAWALGAVARLVPELQERLAANVGKGGEAAPAHPGLGGLEMDEEQVRLFAGVTQIVATLSERAPILLVLEDLHWAGESTLGLLHHLARHLAESPVLIAGTFRPEAAGVQHPLRTLRRRLAREGLARLLRLSCLPQEAVETLIVEMSGADKAVQPLAKRLYLETEGNPFFLIEIVKTLFETNLVHLEGGVWQGDFSQLSAGVLPLPTSLSETIQARVRRLEKDAQEALRLAAVIGREFSFDLLNVIWAQGEEATLEALDNLLRQRLVEEAVVGGNSDFAFTHHKIQEVVYESLPRPRRLHLHAQVGMAMESLYAADLQARSGELAHHFELACRADRSLCGKAVTYLLSAGQQAVRQSANQEAIAYYRRGLDILDTLPETAERIQQEVALQLALAEPTAVVFGYAAPETRRVYDRARDLCRELGEKRADTRALFTSLVGLARYYGVGGEIETGLQIAGQLLAIAQTAGDDILLIEAYRQVGAHMLSLGRLREAQAFFERAISLYDVARHESHAYRFGHDPAATCLGLLSQTLWLLGSPDQAQAQAEKLRNLALCMTHPSSLAYAHCFLAIHACMRHDVPATQSHAEAAIELGQRHGLPTWTAMATALHGWTLIEQGLGMQGLALLRDGTAAYRARGFAHIVPFLLGLQAQACMELVMLTEAAAVLLAACGIVHEGTDRVWLAELKRLEGELAQVRGGDSGEAEAHFRQAIDTARGQEARMLELRATVSLARLWGNQGRRRDAYEVLAEVYHWFEEGLATRDLQAAGALLRTLA